MAIATLAAVNQFVFADLHIRLKAPTDVEIAAQLPRARGNKQPAVIHHLTARKANWRATTFESVDPEWRAYAASVASPLPPLSK